MGLRKLLQRGYYYPGSGSYQVCVTLNLTAVGAFLLCVPSTKDYHLQLMSRMSEALLSSPDSRVTHIRMPHSQGGGFYG